MREKLRGFGTMNSSMIVGLIMIVVGLGTVLAIVWACIQLEGKIDHEEEKQIFRKDE